MIITKFICHFIMCKYISKHLTKDNNIYLFVHKCTTFLRNHLVDMTFGRMRILVYATFRRVWRLVEKKKSGATFFFEIVSSIFDTSSQDTQWLARSSVEPQISHFANFSPYGQFR